MAQALSKYCKNDLGIALNLRYIYTKHRVGLSPAEI